MVLTERKVADVAGRTGAGRPARPRHLLGRALPVDLRADPGNPEGWGSAAILACLIGAAVLMGVFLAIEIRSATRCST